MRAIKFAFNASLMLLKCMQTKPAKGLRAGTKFNFISVEKNKVPSEPAMSLQKLNVSLLLPKGAVLANKSKA